MIADDLAFELWKVRNKTKNGYFPTGTGLEFCREEVQTVLKALAKMVTPEMIVAANDAPYDCSEGVSVGCLIGDGGIESMIAAALLEAAK